MSYGRTPYYIFATFDDMIEFMIPNPGDGSIQVPSDAIAQLIATMEWRDRVRIARGLEPDETGLAAFIARGRELRGDALCYPEEPPI